MTSRKRNTCMYPVIPVSSTRTHTLHWRNTSKLWNKVQTFIWSFPKNHSRFWAIHVDKLLQLIDWSPAPPGHGANPFRCPHCSFTCWNYCWGNTSMLFEWDTGVFRSARPSSDSGATAFWWGHAGHRSAAHQQQVGSHWVGVCKVGLCIEDALDRTKKGE